MSHQFQFYLTPTDARELEVIFRDKFSACILHARSLTEYPRVVESTDIAENGKQWLYFYLTRNEDLSNIKLRFVRTQGYWVVDEQESPVIEFIKCYFAGDTLRRGRMYYVDGNFDHAGLWQQKNNAFLKWAHDVFAISKKMLIRQNSYYIGRDAFRWLEVAGGRLTTR